MDTALRFRLLQSAAALTLFGIEQAFQPTQSQSKYRTTRGGGRKHLPGGLRGMSQRQRRKRIRQGVIKSAR